MIGHVSAKNSDVVPKDVVLRNVPETGSSAPPPPPRAGAIGTGVRRSGRSAIASLRSAWALDAGLPSHSR